MQSSAIESTYTASEEEYQSLVSQMTELAKQLSPRDCDELLETADIPFFASDSYKRAHSILRRKNNNELKPTRNEVILTRELFHALKLRAASLLGNRFFNKSKQLLLDHVHYIGAYAFATPQDFTHSRLMDKIGRIDPAFDVGLCFPLAASAVMAVMLNDLNIFDERVKRVECSSLWRISKLKGFLANKRELASLSDAEKEDAVFFQVLMLFQKINSFRQLRHEADSVGHQDFFAAVKIAAPEKLGALALCGIFTWKYDRRGLARVFDKLEDLYFSDENPTPKAIMISSLRHIICVTFDYKENAWRLINAAPSFLVRKEFIADRVLKTFSMKDLNSIVLNFQIVTFASARQEQSQEHYQGMEAFQAWHHGYIEKTLESAKTYDDLEASVLQVAALSGDMFTVGGLLESGVDVNNARGLPALECAVKSNHLCIAEMLITAGANVNYQNDRSGFSIFAGAIMIGNVELLARLLQEKQLNPTAVHQFTEEQFVYGCDYYQVPNEKRDAFLRKHLQKSTVIFTAMDLLELVDYPGVRKLLLPDEAKAINLLSI